MCIPFWLCNDHCAYANLFWSRRKSVLPFWKLAWIVACTDWWLEPVLEHMPILEHWNRCHRQRNRYRVAHRVHTKLVVSNRALCRGHRRNNLGCSSCWSWRHLRRVWFYRRQYMIFSYLFHKTHAFQVEWCRVGGLASELDFQTQNADNSCEDSPPYCRRISVHCPCSDRQVHDLYSTQISGITNAYTSWTGCCSNLLRGLRSEILLFTCFCHRHLSLDCPVHVSNRPICQSNSAYKVAQDQIPRLRQGFSRAYPQVDDSPLRKSYGTQDFRETTPNVRVFFLNSLFVTA